MTVIAASVDERLRLAKDAAREVALTKPIIVMKPGRTAEAARAAASHTGSLAGSDEVLDAAFRRAGVLRAERISDLFYFAEVLGKQPRPKGPNLTIVSNAGGPGVLATDVLIGGGARLTELSPDTKAALDEVLPPTWSHGNPIDIIGDAPPERYARLLVNVHRSRVSSPLWASAPPPTSGAITLLPVKRQSRTVSLPLVETAAPAAPGVPGACDESQSRKVRPASVRVVATVVEPS